MGTSCVVGTFPALTVEEEAVLGLLPPGWLGCQPDLLPPDAKTSGVKVMRKHEAERKAHSTLQAKGAPYRMVGNN